MKAYRHLVKHFLAQGCSLSVWDGEEWQVKRSQKFTAVIEAIESVEEAQVRIRDANGDVIGTAAVSAFGLEDDETVIDFTCTSALEAWDAAYSAN